MSSKATRFMYGMNFDSASDFGGGRPPMIDGDMSGTGDFVSSLSAMKASGARAIMKFTGISQNAMDSASKYSFLMWKAAFDKAVAKTNARQMGNFVQDGTLVAHYLFDDYSGDGVFIGGRPTFAQLEEAAAYSKSLWSQVPTCLRGDNRYNRDICIAAGSSQYTYVDFGWNQWSNRFGAPQTHFQNALNAGRQVGLGQMFGFNLINGGSGITAPWNIGSGTRWSMSPQELDAITNACSAITLGMGVMGWSARVTADDDHLYDMTSIQTALQRMANMAVGRVAGPTNFRDIPSGITSGSTATVVGNWALVQLCGNKRANDSASLDVPVAALPAAGNLLLLQTYSRDGTLKSSATPSGWTQAKRISGNSAQGGELALYYKSPAVGNEASVTVEFTGGSTSGVAQIATVVEYSGNTGTTGILSATGSARSWPAGSSNMGPVPGMVSTTSDALVVVCAGKANDFNATNLPPTTIMSATTSGGETWNRAFVTGTAAGDDGGQFMDYTALAATASLTSKSWSQTTQVTSGSSGPGCGFMASFGPRVITSGAPPAIMELVDVEAWSIASTFGFTLTASGNTPITWSKNSAPSNLTLNTSTGAFTWTPLAAGTYGFDFGATNSFGTDSDQFRMVVVASGVTVGNVPPSITHPGDQSVVAQARLSFLIQAVDADGDAIAFSLENAPAGSLVIEGTGQFSWIPTGDQGPGTYPIVVVASDGQNESRSTFTVSVSDVPWTRVIGGDSGGAKFTRI